MKLPAHNMLGEIVRRSRLWKAEQPDSLNGKPTPPMDADSADVDVATTERAFVPETAEAVACGEIEDYVINLGSFEFRKLVAALRRGMAIRRHMSQRPMRTVALIF
jgi:hypothetical protein